MTAQQLKNSILQLAVQGKLVPQDPNDEPASVLLERIKAEKQALIKEGKIKKEKKPSEIFRGSSRNLPYTFCEQTGKEIRDISGEIPFDIPENWEWCRLGTVFHLIMGQSPKGDKVFEGKNGIEFHQGKIYFGKRYIDISNQSTNEPTKIAPKNSVLLCVRAPVGKVNKLKTRHEVFYLNFLCLSGIILIDNKSEFFVIQARSGCLFFKEIITSPRDIFHFNRSVSFCCDVVFINTSVLTIKREFCSRKKDCFIFFGNFFQHYFSFITRNIAENNARKELETVNAKNEKIPTKVKLVKYELEIFYDKVTFDAELNKS